MRDPQQAFTDAIKTGRLSTSPKAENYAGKYMFMGVSPRTGNDLFKHIDTRRYHPQQPEVYGGIPAEPISRRTYNK